MFGSIALDITISLVLIYLLYSLLVSIVGEMVSSKLHLRAKMLKSAICNMLLDDKTVERSWIEKQWNNLRNKKRKDYEHSLAENFYNYPSIKYLGKNEYRKLPSYISKENFSDTLFNMLRERGTGTDDMSKITFCLKYNTLNIDNETKKHLLNLFQIANSNPDSFKISLQNWFAETMDRLNGWYKRKNRLILLGLSFILAVSFNVDSIKIAKILSKDKEARTQMVQMATAFVKDSLRYHDFIVSNGDTLPARAVIDTGYANIRKDIDDANLILGLGWGFDKLKKDYRYCLDPKRDSITTKKIASIYSEYILPAMKGTASLRKKIEILSNSISHIKREKLKSDSILAEKNFWAAIGKADSVKVRRNSDSLRDRIAMYQHQITNQNYFIKYYSDSLSILKANQNSYYQKVNEFVGDRFSNGKAIYYNPKTYTLAGKINYNPFEKLWYVTKNAAKLSSILGFLITALALSLGAPFWFDLLKKLISIRSSGVNPDEKNKGENIPSPNPTPDIATQKSNFSQSVLPNQIKEDPIDTALRIYGNTIKNIKGVVNVAQGYLKEESKVLKCVQINVEDQDTSVRVKSIYSQLRIGENEFVPTNILITGKAILRACIPSYGIKEKGIANKNLRNCWGSFGCIVQDRFFPEKKYILTCYHVVNGDESWNGKPTNKQIINHENKIISENYLGYLNRHQDSALVEVSDDTIQFFNSLANVRQPKGIREVSDNDLYFTEVFINGYSTKESSGVITHYHWDDFLPYGNIDYKIEDMLVISHFDRNGYRTAITTLGDSGSIVLDRDNFAIGIVVAGDYQNTYAIKISTIFTELGLKLII